MRLFNYRGIAIRGLWLALLMVSAGTHAQWEVEGFETEDDDDWEAPIICMDEDAVQNLNAYRDFHCLHPDDRPPNFKCVDSEDYYAENKEYCDSRPEKEETVGDTWDIVEATVKCVDCFDWAPIGLCFWADIQIIPPKVTITSTPLVKNYLPDFVVTAYSNQTPYPEMGGITDRNNGAILTEKMDWHGDANQVDTNLDFKHVDIITNPAIPIYNAMGEGLELSCKSVEKIPYFPHYISDKDPAWAKSFVEQLYPQAILGMPRMSRLPDFWGPIYPRTGWTSLPHDAMSALVVAQRASEILTGGLSSHLFIPPGDDCGDKCWPPSAVELDDSNNKFQQIFPSKDIDDDAHPLPRDAKWIRGREYGNQKYAWVMWRRYECCERTGDIFIDRIVIGEF